MRAFLRVVFFVSGPLFGLAFLANLFSGEWGTGPTQELAELSDLARLGDMALQGLACVGSFVLVRRLGRRNEQPVPPERRPAYQLLDPGAAPLSISGSGPARPATIPASHPVSWVGGTAGDKSSALRSAPSVGELEAARARLAAAEAEASNAESVAAGLRAAANEARIGLQRLERARTGDVPDSFPYR